MRLASIIICTASLNVMPFSATGWPSSKRTVTSSRLTGDVVAPRRDAHDRLDDRDAGVEPLEILGFVRGAEHVRVGRVRLLGAHVVRQADLSHVLRHLGAAAELVDERLVEPRLVDAQARVGEQPVAIEAFDVVALERAPVAPDVDVVFLHRADEHRAGDRAADRRRVEVRNAGGGDVKRAALQDRQSLGDELRAAVDEAGLFGAVLQRAPRNLVVVRLVGLTEVRGVGVRDRALAAHPVQRRARVEPARERDADAFAGRQFLKNVGHETHSLSSFARSASEDAPSPWRRRAVLPSATVFREELAMLETSDSQCPGRFLRSSLPPSASDGTANHHRDHSGLGHRRDRRQPAGRDRRGAQPRHELRAGRS